MIASCIALVVLKLALRVQRPALPDQFIQHHPVDCLIDTLIDLLPHILGHTPVRGHTALFGIERRTFDRFKTAF